MEAKMTSSKRTLDVLYSDNDLGTYKFAFIELGMNDQGDEGRKRAEMRYARKVKEELRYLGIRGKDVIVKVVDGKLILDPQCEEASERLSEILST